MVWDETYSSGIGDYANYQSWVQNEFKETDFGTILQSSRNMPEGGMSVTIEGVPEVVAALNHYMQEVPELVYDTLIQYAEQILTDAKNQIPWDTTHLMQTGTVEAVKGGQYKSLRWEEGAGFFRTSEPIDAEDGTIVIGFNTPYALRQHEDMTMYHPKPGRKAKYLEDPAMAMVPKIMPGIVNRINDYLTKPYYPDMTRLSAGKRASLGNAAGRFI